MPAASGNNSNNREDTEVKICICNLIKIGYIF